MGRSPLNSWIDTYDREKLKLCHQNKPDILFKADENGIRPIDKILRSQNPKNHPEINKLTMEELGFTEQEQRKVGLEKKLRKKQLHWNFKKLYMKIELKMQ